MKKFLAVVLAGVMVFSLAACSGGDAQTGGTPTTADGEEGSKTKNTLNYGLSADPAGLDPQTTSDGIASQVMAQVFDNLVSRDEDGNYHAELAEDWVVSEDGTELTFTLRQGVKFHNGETMTADDVVFSINRAIESSITKTITSNIQSVEKIDDNTVKVTLPFPYGAALECISNHYLVIISQKAYEEDPEGFNTNPVGTGPYRFVSWERGSKVTLERFEEYWGDPASIQNVVFKVYTDSSTAVLAFEAGELDFMYNVPQVDRAKFLDTETVNYVEAPMNGNAFILFNNRDGVFSDVRVRQAVTYAVDRDAIVIGALEGVGIPVSVIVSPVATGYPEDLQGNPRDLEKAKALLAEAGYPNGFSVEMKIAQGDMYKKPSEIIQSQLAEIGIDVQISLMEKSTWSQEVITNRNYDMSFEVATYALNDGDAIYNFYHSDKIDNGLNHVLCAIPELDELLDAGKRTTDQEARNEIYRQVCQIILDQAVVCPVYTSYASAMAPNTLKGLDRASSVNEYNVKDFSWSE